MPGEQYIVSIKRGLHEELFDGSKVNTNEAVSLAGLEKVISLSAKHREPETVQERIDLATNSMALAVADNYEEHHVLTGEEELSKMVDAFMSIHQRRGTSVSYDIPDSSIAHIPRIASKFGVVQSDDLPGQYL